MKIRAETDTHKKSPLNTAQLGFTCALIWMTGLMFEQDGPSWGVLVFVPLACAAGMATELRASCAAADRRRIVAMSIGLMTTAAIMQLPFPGSLLLCWASGMLAAPALVRSGRVFLQRTPLRFWRLLLPLLAAMPVVALLAELDAAYRFQVLALLAAPGLLCQRPCPPEQTPEKRPRAPLPLETVDEHRFTGREKEVLSCLADGCTTAQISQKLFISERTVRHHISSMLAKTGVKSRVELLLLLLR